MHFVRRSFPDHRSLGEGGGVGGSYGTIFKMSDTRYQMSDFRLCACESRVCSIIVIYFCLLIVRCNTKSTSGFEISYNRSRFLSYVDVRVRALSAEAFLTTAALAKVVCVGGSYGTIFKMSDTRYQMSDFRLCACESRVCSIIVIYFCLLIVRCNTKSTSRFEISYHRSRFLSYVDVRVRALSAEAFLTTAALAKVVCVGGSYWTIFKMSDTRYQMSDFRCQISDCVGER